jgi:hypothetical protein
MTGADWRRTRLTRDLIRCDLCGKKADTVHFLTDGQYPGTGGADDQIEAVFACPDHDAGGTTSSLLAGSIRRRGFRSTSQRRLGAEQPSLPPNAESTRSYERRPRATGKRTSWDQAADESPAELVKGNGLARMRV